MFVAVILQRHIKPTSVGTTQYFVYATVQSVLTYVRLYKSGNANPTRSPMASHRWLVSEQPTCILILVCYDDRSMIVVILPGKDRGTCWRRRGISHCRRAAQLSSYACYGQKAAVCCAQDWTELSNKHTNININ